jgi:hypothetical protein
MELLHLHLFGRAPGGAVVGAGVGALPSRAEVSANPSRPARMLSKFIKGYRSSDND